MSSNDPEITSEDGQSSTILFLSDIVLIVLLNEVLEGLNIFSIVSLEQSVTHGLRRGVAIHAGKSCEGSHCAYNSD